MKRKAQSQEVEQTKKPATALAKKTATPSKKAVPAKPQLRGAPKQPQQTQKTPQRKVLSKEEKEFLESSDDEDIGDIDEYLKGEDADTNVVLDFDDGEVSFNLNKKKQQLFDSDDDDEEEEEKEKDIGAQKTKRFSDDNSKWLKSADDEGDDDDDEDEDESGDADARIIRKIKKAEDKKKQLEDDIKLADQDLKELIQQQEDEDSDEEDEKEDIQDVANRMENLYSKIQESVGILSDFKERRPKNVSREEFVKQLKTDLMSYFGYTEFLMDLYFHLFTPTEALSHIEANEVPRPLTIRVNTLKAVRKDLAQTMITKGVSLKPIKWSKVGLVIYESKIPIGATPEYLAGQYMLQSAASFLPVLSLDPQPNEEVLDMCAAPGGKTTYIAALMKNTGCVHANDKNAERIHALDANIHRMGVRNCVISNLDGVAIPTLPLKFDRVLVDAPCMGLGVIAKDRSIKSSKDEKDMQVCIDIQIKLLLAAIDAVDISKAAIIVYSTCSISVEENEAIVDKALKKRFVKVLDSGLEFGKEGFTRYRGKEFHPSLRLSRRYYPHAHNIDGFYVCKLHKYANGERNKTSKEDFEAKQIELLNHRAPLVLRKNADKLAKGQLLFTDEPHVFDQAKEAERSKKTKDKKSRKKQNRLARMKANAEDDGEEEEDGDMDMPDVIPEKDVKSNNKSNGPSKATNQKGSTGSGGPKKMRGGR